MAKSLTVKHEEVLATSPLFNTFLAVAMGWMVVGAFIANWVDSAAAVTP